MFNKVLIANRGAIACRIIRTLQRMGIASVAVYSEADAGALHVRMADEAYCIGPAPAAQCYLRQDIILDVARRSGAAAIHPGYGFLSENAEFATACEAAGIAFIGPTPAQMRSFGLKHSARALAEASNLPLLPGSGLLSGLEAALEAAARVAIRSCSRALRAVAASACSNAHHPRTSRAPSTACAALPPTTSAMAVYSSKSMW